MRSRVPDKYGLKLFWMSITPAGDDRHCLGGKILSII